MIIGYSREVPIEPSTTSTNGRPMAVQPRKGAQQPLMKQKEKTWRWRKLFIKTIWAATLNVNVSLSILKSY
jgi:hypothetical protein